jgi:hypothetical protein
MKKLIIGIGNIFGLSIHSIVKTKKKSIFILPNHLVFLAFLKKAKIS